MLREVLGKQPIRRPSSTLRPAADKLSGRVQPKLARGAGSSLAERAADDMASRVMAGQAVPANQGAPAYGLDGLELPAAVASQLSASKGAGAPLTEGVRSYMEPHFGWDFANVRVHTDDRAHQMTDSLAARAFAHGTDIYLSRDVSPSVNPVLAHELSHVTQQTGVVQCLPHQRAKGGVLYRVRAVGVQGYEGDPKKPTPHASLYAGGRQVGIHRGHAVGPYWQFTAGPFAGSWVVGRGADKATFATTEQQKGDIDWLEMPVYEAGGRLKDVGRIRRVNTTDGVMASGMEASSSESSYRCYYEFCTFGPA